MVELGGVGEMVDVGKWEIMEKGFGGWIENGCGNGVGVSEFLNEGFG